MKQFFFINGLFWQERAIFLVKHKEDIGEAVAVSEAMIHSFFAGIVVPHEDDKEKLIGIIQDHYGEAKLTDFLLTENSLSFTKEYLRRPYPIFYEYKKDENGIWRGTWDGPEVGCGWTRCVLLPVEESFYSPNDLFKDFPLEQSPKF